MVTMVMVLDTVGLDSSSVGVILSIDWLLDRYFPMFRFIEFLYRTRNFIKLDGK